MDISLKTKVHQQNKVTNKTKGKKPLLSKTNKIICKANKNQRTCTENSEFSRSSITLKPNQIKLSILCC